MSLTLPTPEQKARDLDEHLRRTNPELFKERQAAKAEMMGDDEFWRAYRLDQGCNLVRTGEPDVFDYCCIGASSELTD